MFVTSVCMCETAVGLVAPDRCLFPLTSNSLSLYGVGRQLEDILYLLGSVRVSCWQHGPYVMVMACVDCEASLWDYNSACL